MNYTWSLNRILSFSSQVLLVLVALINISCQSEIAAKFPDSFGKSPNNNGGDEVTETANGVDLTKPFIFKWTIDEAGQGLDPHVALPLIDGYQYNFTIVWGDGQTSEITSWDDPDKYHTYPGDGTYTAMISGLMEAWGFKDGYIFAANGDYLGWDTTNSTYKLSGIVQLGHTGWKNLSGAFHGCSLVDQIAIGETDTSRVTSMQMMFYKVASSKSSAIDVDLSTIQTQNVTDMNGMFAEAKIANLNLTGLNTSNVTDMSTMFRSANESNLSIIGLANFNTSKVTNMSEMFYQYPQATLDLSSFDTRNVTNMAGMFSSLTNITALNLSTFNTSNVTNMSEMFYKYPLATLDLSSFDTRNVAGMYQMFASSKLTSLNLTNFNTSNVTTMAGMFQSMNDLTTLNLSTFNTANVVYLANMFSYLPQLTELDLTSFRLDSATSIKEMFLNSSIPTLRLNNWDLSSGPTTTDLFTDFTGSIYCDQAPFGDPLSITCQ